MDISSTPFFALLRRCLPAKYTEVFSGYNHVCEFLRRTVSPHDDKAALVEVKLTVLENANSYFERLRNHAAMTILTTSTTTCR